MPSVAAPGGLRPPPSRGRRLNRKHDRRVQPRRIAAVGDHQPPALAIANALAEGEGGRLVIANRGDTSGLDAAIVLPV